MLQDADAVQQQQIADQSAHSVDYIAQLRKCVPFMTLA
jgi:hypothetical protein